MSPKPKDDREEPEDAAAEDAAAEDAAAEDAAPEGSDASEAAAAAYGRRTITKSGKFPKTQIKSPSSPGKPQMVAPITIREEGKLMGSRGTSRYTLVAPRSGKKKNVDPPAE